MPYNSTGTWIEEPSTINPNSLTKDTSTIISKPINKPKVIPYNSDVCDKNQLYNALSYDREVFDLYTLLFKNNNSRTWYNKFRLDESGLNKRLNLFYNILLIRFSDFGRSVANILIKYKLQQFQFNEYCYFQALKNIYINIKRKYLTNPFTSTIEPTMNDAILKVYLFFLVKYFNDYVSRYENMLEQIHKQKAIIISHNHILNNKYNKTYNSINQKSIRELNNRGSTIQKDYKPYILCKKFYESFYDVYNSLLKFSPKFIFSEEVQILIERIDKLHFVLVETVTGRIERNKQRKLEHQQLIEEKLLEREKSEALNASLPPPPPSWTSEFNQRELSTMGYISPEEWQQRQKNFEISLARRKEEESNKQTINACSTPWANVNKEYCNQARARQAKRNKNKANAAIMYQQQYYQTHGIYPPDGPYSH